MLERDRVKLLFGPYRMPRCRVGGFLKCAMRGEIRVKGIQEALIQWPYALQERGGRRVLILCGDLVRAVRNESALAVVHWWGVSKHMVWQWRKVLGVEFANKGTSDLLRRQAPESCQGEKANARRAVAMKSPERAAKIAASKRGKPRPPHVIEAMRRAHLGKPLSAETKRKLSEAYRRRGTYPPAAGRPFTAAEDALLGTATDREIAAKLNRDAKTIHERRKRLGIPAFAKRRIAWTPAMDRKLGKITDENVGPQTWVFGVSSHISTATAQGGCGGPNLRKVKKRLTDRAVMDEI